MVMLGLTHTVLVNPAMSTIFTCDMVSTKKKRYFTKLGPEVCPLHAFFHVFTGCNTVLIFYKISRKKFWNVFYAMIKTGIPRTTVNLSKADNCLKPTEDSSPKYQFTGQSLINITCVRRTPV